MPPRSTAIPLIVDVEGVEIEASIRPPRSDGDNYRVRWKIHGVRQERSTGTRVLAEAKRIARLMVQGVPTVLPSVSIQRGLTVAEFEQVQKDYHALNGRTEAGESTFSEFRSSWRKFLRVCPVKTIQEVTEEVALTFLHRLQGMSKTEDRGYKKKSPQKLAIKTIHKHIRQLSGAWNRVREGHSARFGGLKPHQMVTSNPWEGIRNNIPEAAPEEDEDPVQFELVDNDLGRFLDRFKDRPVGELFEVDPGFRAP